MAIKATRTQAKAALDNMTAAIKADIDLLPSTVNIVDGAFRATPNRWSLTMSEADLAAATALATTLLSTFTARIPDPIKAVSYRRRRADGTKGITVTALPATFIIVF